MPRSIPHAPASSPPAETPSSRDASAGAPRIRARLRRALRGAGGLVLAGLLAGSALAASASFFWLGELVSNLRWQLGAAAIGGAGLLVVGGRRGAALVAVLLAAVHLGPALALSLPAERPAPDELAAAFDVVSANVNVFNEDAAPALRWLRSERPDVVALQEVSALWRAELEGLRDLFPHQIHSPQAPSTAPDEFGMSLLSRFPIVRGEVRWGPRRERPFLEAVLRVGERRVQVVVVHPMRPGWPPKTAIRDEFLQHVASRVSWSEDALVLGDLNATLYSPAFAAFLERASLRDSRAGFGRNASYESDQWVHGLWLDLDHVLLGPGLVAMRRGVGPEIGSDHLPATATLALRALPAEGGPALAARPRRAGVDERLGRRTPGPHASADRGGPESARAAQGRDG